MFLAHTRKSNDIVHLDVCAVGEEIGSNKMSQQLKSKLDKIERSLATIEIARTKANCSCRCETRFHTPEELEKIMAISCLVHSARDVGFVIYTAPWEPINKADWEFCDCPPSLRRDMKMGRIPLPEDPDEQRRRKEELLQEDRDRMIREAAEGVTPPPAHDFKEWKAKVQEALRKYRQRMS